MKGSATMQPVETITKNGYTAKLYPDEMGTTANPRAEGDNATIIYYHSNHYTLGDKDVSRDTMLDIANDKQNIYLPVYAYIHSDIIMCAEWDNPYNDPWDSGQSGIVVMSRADIRKEYGVKRITKKVLKQAYHLMQVEVEEFSQYLSGDVYGVVVEDAEGEEVDSCWGFYGYNYAVEEANRMLESAMKGSAE
jgi:hypothetical protein